LSTSGLEAWKSIFLGEIEWVKAASSTSRCTLNMFLTRNPAGTLNKHWQDTIGTTTY